MRTDSEIKALAEEIFNKHSWNALGAISPSKHFCIDAMMEMYKAALSGTEAKEVVDTEFVYVPIQEGNNYEIVNAENSDQYAYLSTMGGQTVALAKKVHATSVPPSTERVECYLPCSKEEGNFYIENVGWAKEITLTVLNPSKS